MRRVLTSAHRHWRLRSVTALAAVGAMTVSLGVVLLGATTVQVNADEPCVPQDAWTETIQHPAVTHTETTTVVDRQAWTEVVAAQAGRHYSWNGGNLGVNDPPTVVPNDADPQNPWQVQGVGFDPHLQGEGDPATWYPVDPATSGLHVVGNSPSNASWFYYVPPVPEQRIEHPAVTHTVTNTVVDTAAWTEFIYHPAVSCEETEPKDVCPNIEGDQAEVPDGYQLEDGDCVQIAGEETIIPTPKPEKPELAVEPDKEPTVKGVEVVAPPTAAPTAVAAGLADDTGLATGQLLGQGMAGLGLVLLVAAGWLSVPRLTRGVRQS